MTYKIKTLGACRRQKNMCFGYPGFVLCSAADNPDFDPNRPFAALLEQRGRWQLHLRNFTKESSSCLVDFLAEVSRVAWENGIEEIWCINPTPGGMSALEKLSEFGFKKNVIPVECQSLTDSHWPTPDTEGGVLNLEKLSRWLANPLHAGSFLVVKGGELVSPLVYQGGLTYKNTVPRLFRMTRREKG